MLLIVHSTHHYHSFLFSTYLPIHRILSNGLPFCRLCNIPSNVERHPCRSEYILLQQVRLYNKNSLYNHKYLLCDAFVYPRVVHLYNCNLSPICRHDRNDGRCHLLFLLYILFLFLLFHRNNMSFSYHPTSHRRSLSLSEVYRRRMNIP